jgi:hypothetical protein
MANVGNSNDSIQSYVDCYEDFDTVDACDWGTLSLNDRQTVDDGCIASPHRPSWTISSTASPTHQRRFALGYSVLTEANARLACFELSAEQHWDRVKGDQSKVPGCQSACKSDMSTHAGLEVDFFPRLVPPRNTKSAVSFVSMSMPTPPLQRRLKRLREDLEILQDGPLPTSSPPFTDVSPVTPTSCTEDTPRTTRETGNCMWDNPKALDTLAAPSL